MHTCLALRGKEEGVQGVHTYLFLCDNVDEKEGRKLKGVDEAYPYKVHFRSAAHGERVQERMQSRRECFGL